RSPFDFLQYLGFGGSYGFLLRLLLAALLELLRDFGYLRLPFLFLLRRVFDRGRSRRGSGGNYGGGGRFFLLGPQVDPAEGYRLLEVLDPVLVGDVVEAEVRFGNGSAKGKFLPGLPDNRDTLRDSSPASVPVFAVERGEGVSDFDKLRGAGRHKHPEVGSLLPELPIDLLLGGLVFGAVVVPVRSGRAHKVEKAGGRTGGDKLANRLLLVFFVDMLHGPNDPGVTLDKVESLRMGTARGVCVVLLAGTVPKELDGVVNHAAKAGPVLLLQRAKHLLVGEEDVREGTGLDVIVRPGDIGAFVAAERDKGADRRFFGPKREPVVLLRPGPDLSGEDKPDKTVLAGE